MTETDPFLPLMEQLQERFASDETLEIEFKAARGGLPAAVWDTVSSFANTSGGWIILGVSFQDSIRVVENLKNPQKLLQDFTNLMRNSQKVSTPVCGPQDSAVIPFEGKQIVVLRIPAAPRKNRPVYINGNPYQGTFVRRNEGDYHCSKQEVDRMMREASDDAADSTILSHYGIPDIDSDALSRYRRRFQTQNVASPWNSYDDKRFLQALGAFAKNRETGDEGITAAGLLLLGSEEALKEWRSRHLIDYRLVPSDADSETRWEDRVAWEGNLLGAFETIYPRLTADQAAPFRLKGGGRVDEGPVQIVLREALVNLLVHADYAETQVSLIKHSAEGYYFRNPGSSRIPETELFAGDRSDPRNPTLVRMFRLIGIADEAGTGMPKIIKNWRQLGFRLPKIDVGTEHYEFVLSLRHAHLVSEEDRVWLAGLGEEWTEPEQLALLVARHDGEIDNPKLRRLTGQHPADVTKVFASLRSRDLLQMVRGGRNASYQLGSSALGGKGTIRRVPTDEDGRLPYLNSRQQSVVDHLRKHTVVSSTQYQQLFSISERQARNDLSHLIHMGVLVRTGKGPASRYLLSPTWKKATRESGTNPALPD